MSKIQDLRNPKRPIRKRLPSRKVAFDWLVDVYATIRLIIQWAIAAFAFYILTMMTYGLLRGLITSLPNIPKLIIALLFLIAQAPLADLAGILLSAALVALAILVHAAWLARIDSPFPRGRRILSGVEARRLAEKKLSDPKTGKTRNRPKL